MNQREFLETLCEENPDAIIVGSIGTISYDLKEIDHPKKVLVKGAMGHAMAIGLGMALGSNERVIVVIGDGSYLMKAGSAATILAQKPKNLRVIVLNNNSYRSCGGQGTDFESLRPHVPFETVDV